MPSWLSTRLPALGAGLTRERWPAIVAIAAVFAVVALPIYLLGGLGEWSPAFEPSARQLALAVGFLLLPSLPEEFLWRWLLIPPSAFTSARRAVAAVAFSSFVFTAAHPLAAWLFVPHAWPVFTAPAFLLIVLLLGVACGSLYVVSRSVWPPVALHWVTVLAWKFLLGGPFVLLGR